MRLAWLLVTASALFGQTPSLSSPDARDRARAVLELRNAGDRAAAIRTLVRMTGDGDAEVRAAAANAFGEFEADARPAVPALMQLLQDPDWHVRERSAYALGRIGPGAAEAIPYLLPLLADSSYLVRWQGAQALGGIGPAAAGTRNHLLGLWHDESPHVRGAVVTALSNVATNPRDALVYAVPALNDASVEVRRAAADALSKWAAGAAAVVPEIRRALRDPEFTVQGGAIGALFRMPPSLAAQFVPDAVELLNNRDNHFSTRSAAADFLAEAGEPAAVAADDLRAALQDPHDWVRRAARRALQSLGVPEGGSAATRTNGARSGRRLAELAEQLNAANHWTRVDALREMAAFQERVAPYQQAIFARLAAGSRDEKFHAIRALSGLRVDTEAAVSKMLPLLAVADLRSEVLKSLMAMGPGAAPALPALIALLEGDDGDSLRLSLDVIRAIGSGAGSAAPSVARLLARDEAPVRRAALQTLNGMSAAATPALPMLYQVLDDPDVALQGEAAYAIAQIFACNGASPRLPAEAGHKLLALLTADHTEARRRASYALSWVRPTPAGAVDALTQAVRDEDHQVRAQAAWALSKAGGAAAVPVIAGLLTDPSARVRGDAAMALRQMGPKARGALAALRVAAADPDVEVQTSARRAIAAIE